MKLRIRNLLLLLILISCAAAGFAAGFTETKKMAEAGDASAQYNLGVMYEKGDGVLKDSVEAHAWYYNASANGVESAKKNLSNIEKTMNPDQISDANKLAREIFNRISTNKN